MSFRSRGNIVRCLMRPALLLASALLASIVLAAATKQEEAATSDGLERVDVEGMDMVYVRRGATLSAYDKVLIDPVEASFHKDWDSQKMGSSFILTSKERDDIGKKVATIVHEELVKELRANSRYQVVDAAGQSVLRIKAKVTNLYVNAPDTIHSDRRNDYSVSAGEMTLVEELSDSESGQLLARVMDRSAQLDSKSMTISSGVYDIGESRTIASEWAKILRDRLDRAHDIGRR